MASTDEHMDDLATRMDAGFERSDKDIRELRADMNRGFVRVDNEIIGLRDRRPGRTDRSDRSARGRHRDRLAQRNARA